MTAEQVQRLQYLVRDMSGTLRVLGYPTAPPPIEEISATDTKRLRAFQREQIARNRRNLRVLRVLGIELREEQG